MNKKLLLIVILTFLIRFIGLSSLPPALNRDEAAIGWNAYSILTTAHDEHGQYLPLAFKSIGDYKMPLYIYASTIPIKLFGLNDFSIRFWSALAGIVSVIAIYYIVLELTKKKTLAIITAMLLALNPWAIFYSRVGFEANLALAFFLTGLYCLLRGLKKPVWFGGGLSLFLLAFLTYSASLIFIPMILLVFLIIYRSSLKPRHFIFLIIFTILSLTIFKSLWSISAQKANITVFSDPTIINQYNQTRTRIFNQNPILAKTWWNKQVFFFRLITQNYFKSFSPKFLFTVGGHHPWHRVPGVGNFYYLEIALALIGLVWLYKQKNKQLKILLIAWLLLAPLPSAITVDAPHSTRSLHLLPVVLILSAFGLLAILKRLTQIKKTRVMFLLISLYLINLVYFSYQYIMIYPQQFPGSIPLGLKQLIINHQPTGKIYFFGIHDSNYLYSLIYLNTDPQQFQQTSRWTAPDLINLTNVYQFGQINIVNYADDIKDPDYVFWPTNQSLTNFNLEIIDQAGFYSIYKKP